MKNITRTISSTKVEYVGLEKNDNGDFVVVDGSITFEGALDQKAIDKALAKKDLKVEIKDVTVTNGLYSMPVEDFIKHAEVIESANESAE